MDPKRIVITGGPGTGKTSIVTQLEYRGFHCFHEIIRTMTLDAKKEGRPEAFVTNPLAFVSDPYVFNQNLLEGRIVQYREATRIMEPFVFYDRGIPDILGYMDYFEQAYEAHFIEACSENRYDHVVLLPPWEEIYVSDNERMESFEEALDIHDRLEAIYVRFGYKPLAVPMGPVEERVTYILNELIGEE